MDTRGNLGLLLLGAFLLLHVIPNPFRLIYQANFGQPAAKRQPQGEQLSNHSTIHHTVKLSHHHITLSEFNQLQEGMHSIDVVKVLGLPGNSLVRKNPAPEEIGIKLYAWKNADGSLCSVTFKDDRLTHKTQVRLQD